MHTSQEKPPEQPDKSEGDQNFGPPTARVETHGRSKYVVVVHSSRGQHLASLYVKEDKLHPDSRMAAYGNFSDWTTPEPAGV